MEHILMVDGRWRRPTIAAMEGRLSPQNAELLFSYRRTLSGSYSTSHVVSLHREALKFALVQQNAGYDPAEADVGSIIAYCGDIESASSTSINPGSAWP